MALKTYSNMVKSLKLIVRKFWRQILALTKVTGEKLAWRPFCPPPSWILSTDVQGKGKLSISSESFLLPHYTNINRYINPLNASVALV